MSIDPNRIKKLFAIREANREGIYCIALCLNGIWEEVIVDDFFPIFPYSKAPVFSSLASPEIKGTDEEIQSKYFNQIWLMLLEKAFAKVCGGYGNMDRGHCREALKLLTGSPTMNYFCKSCINEESESEKVYSPFANIEREDEHWENIRSGFSNGYVFTCSSNELSGVYTPLGTDTKTGLHPNHSYSILGAFEIEKDDSGVRSVRDPSLPTNRNNDRMIKLRNPWGKSNWSGLWSDQD